MTFPTILNRKKYTDGVVCTCGQVKDEIEVLACDGCSDAMCIDCLTDCAECGKSVCYNCVSVFECTVCQECEGKYVASLITLTDHDDRFIKDNVFLVVSGNEYPINTKYNIEMIDGTDSILPFENRIKYLDIKGLGLLRYSHRAIRGRGKGNGVEYHIYCNPAIEIDDLPY